MSFPSYTRVGDWVHLSGQVALDEREQVVGDGDVGAQTTQTLRGVEAVLRAAGGGLSNVVSATVFLTSARSLPAFDAAWGIAFGNHRPARTTVVTELLDQRFLVEVQTIAFIAVSGVLDE